MPRKKETLILTGEGAKKIKTVSAVQEDELADLYNTKAGFLDSVGLEDIKKTMTWR